MAAHPNPLVREVYGEAGKASAKFMEATKRALQQRLMPR